MTDPTVNLKNRDLAVRRKDRDQPVHLKNRLLAAFLAWLVPGLGHIYQGRTGKGLLYAACILSLFFVGLALGDWRIVYWRWISPTENSEQFCFPYLGQFWAGLPALPALIQGTLKWYHQDFILWGFMAEPAQEQLNGLYQPQGKFIEIGSLYATVAGLLNILAIYDAYDGPAHVDEEDPAPAQPDGKPVVIEVAGGQV
jgi:hypothetical protein